MKSLFVCLTLAAASPLAALAQTKPAAKPAARPVARPAATPAAKPVAKPSPPPTAKPAAPAPRPAPAATPPPAPSRKVAAVEGSFGVGTNVVNLGIGLGSRYTLATAFLGGSSSSSPAFSVSGERGIRALGPGYLGIGAIVGYQYSSYTYTLLGTDSGWRNHDVVLMARAAFHYNVTPQLDTYGGLGVGLRYSHESYTYSATSDNTVYLTSGIYVGARYYFSESIGAFAEAGYDQSFIKIGLAAKF